MNKRRLCVLLLVLAVGLGFGGYYRYWRYNLHHFAVVHPGVLYRSALPSQRGLEYLVEQCGVRTVLCILPEEPSLKSGLFFSWGGSRLPESIAVQQHGRRFLRWPVGEEQVYWPWPQSEQFEEFFRIFDDPQNLPVTVHCQQGRHRTGTCVALFRLEYDRWDVERALAEMYSFDFGPPPCLQEHNLRTYHPRPRPEATAWPRLSTALSQLLPQPAADYEELVRGLRALGDTPERAEALSDYLETGQPFGLCLAARLIDQPGDRLVPLACETADRVAQSSDAAPPDWATAAALLADFGSPEQQTRLLELLSQDAATPTPSPRHQALVAGLTNRYTVNRVAYLLPLLSDRRFRPEPAARQYRYCDTATAHLATIVNQRFITNTPTLVRSVWDAGVQQAQRWFAEHPQAAQVGRHCGDPLRDEAVLKP